MKKIIFFALMAVMALSGCGQKDGGEGIPDNGKVKSYYPSGKIEAEGRLKNGMMDGKWISWYENGKKQREENYKAGNLNGRLTTWDEQGNITYDAEYLDGKETKVYAKK